MARWRRPPPDIFAVAASSGKCTNAEHRLLETEAERGPICRVGLGGGPCPPRGRTWRDASSGPATSTIDSAFRQREQACLKLNLTAEIPRRSSAKRLQCTNKGHPSPAARLDGQTDLPGEGEATAPPQHRHASGPRTANSASRTTTGLSVQPSGFSAGSKEIGGDNLPILNLAAPGARSARRSNDRSYRRCRAPRNTAGRRFGFGLQSRGVHARTPRNRSIFRSSRSWKTFACRDVAQEHYTAPGDDHFAPNPSNC